METIQRAPAISLFSGALKANEYNGKVNVNNHDAENLAKPCSDFGGRAAEVVKKLAAA